jgi:hypothetical protein
MEKASTVRRASGPALNAHLPRETDNRNGLNSSRSLLHVVHRPLRHVSAIIVHVRGAEHCDRLKYTLDVALTRPVAQIYLMLMPRFFRRLSDRISETEERVLKDTKASFGLDDCNVSVTCSTADRLTARCRSLCTCMGTPTHVNLAYCLLIWLMCRLLFQ